MHIELLDPAQVTVLDRLKQVAGIGDFYLAGGTALALRHGHRESIDFDFFRREPFQVRSLARRLQKSFAQFELIPTGEQTLYVRLCEVTTSFFRFPYPLLEVPQPTAWGFPLASDADIAAMKLEAIASRGSRKDFIDLWVICTHGFTLERVFQLFERKFGASQVEHYHRLRALAYFDDAEKDPFPRMARPMDWSEIRSFFATEAARLLTAGIEGR